jgi:hypothetical protein
MLVILTNEQLLTPHQVCQTCPLADHSGQPRWVQGQLRCGRLLDATSAQQPIQYQCQMGFRVASIPDCGL